MQLSVWRILETCWVLFKSEDYLNRIFDYHKAEKGKGIRWGITEAMAVTENPRLSSSNTWTVSEDCSCLRWVKTRLWSSQPLSQSTEQEHCWVICKSESFTSQLLTYPKQFLTCPPAAHMQSSSQGCSQSFSNESAEFVQFVFFKETNFLC